jgi:hypothetical protein
LGREKQQTQQRLILIEFLTTHFSIVIVETSEAHDLDTKHSNEDNSALNFRRHTTAFQSTEIGGTGRSEIRSWFLILVFGRIRLSFSAKAEQ